MKRLYKFWTLFSVLLLSVGLFSCKGEKKKLYVALRKGLKVPSKLN